MKFHFGQNFLRKYRRLTARQPQLKRKISKQLKLLRENPLHPSLRLHKLKGKEVEGWSVSIDKDLRILFIYVPGGILLVDIGSHKEVY